MKAEQLNNAKDYRWHWYEWRRRRGVLVYSVECLRKRLFRLRELLYERCVFQNNCFNTHAGMARKDCCYSDRAIRVQQVINFHPGNWRGDLRQKYLWWHDDASDCAKSRAPLCNNVDCGDFIIKEWRRVRNMPAQMDQWEEAKGRDGRLTVTRLLSPRTRLPELMRQVIAKHTLPQLAILFCANGPTCLHIALYRVVCKR